MATASPKQEMNISATMQPSEEVSGDHRESTNHERQSSDIEKPSMLNVEPMAAGVARIEGMQVVWGKYGKVILWFGLGAMLLT